MRRAAREQQRQHSDTRDAKKPPTPNSAPAKHSTLPQGARTKLSPGARTLSPQSTGALAAQTNLNDSNSSQEVTSECVQCKCMQDSTNVMTSRENADVIADTHDRVFVAGATTSPVGSESVAVWQKRDDPSTCFASYLDYNKFPKKKERKAPLTTFKRDVSNDATGVRISPKRAPAASDLRSPKTAEQRERLLSDDASIATVDESLNGEMYTTRDMTEVLRALPSLLVASPASGSLRSRHDDVIKTPHSKVYTTPSASRFRLPPVSSTCTPSVTSPARDADNRSSTSGSYSMDGTDLCGDSERYVVSESSV